MFLFFYNLYFKSESLNCWVTELKELNQFYENGKAMIIYAHPGSSANMRAVS